MYIYIYICICTHTHTPQSQGTWRIIEPEAIPDGFHASLKGGTLGDAYLRSIRCKGAVLTPENFINLYWIPSGAMKMYPSMSSSYSTWMTCSNSSQNSEESYTGGPASHHRFQDSNGHPGLGLFVCTPTLGKPHIASMYLCIYIYTCVYICIYI